jgi:hypothetical protein
MAKRSASDSILRDVKRRDFLQLALALGGTAWACSTSSSTKGGPPLADAGLDASAEAGALDSVPFGIWQSLRDAVRGSPDHLLQVANKLTANGDPAAIFEFVRDQIVTCPPASHATEVTGIRWGARAALRCGMGTPREKAELLVLLYEQAGLTASVVTSSISTPDDETATIYGQNVQRSFAPTVDQPTLDKWNAQISVAGPPMAQAPIDPDDSQRQAIVQAISALLPASVRATLDGTPPTVESLLIYAIPLVAVQVNGETSYANPLLPTAVFGKPYTSDAAPAAAPAPTPALPVTVELFVSSTANPALRTSVAKATFSADQVVGRQVAVQFLPRVDDPDDLLALRIKDLHAFRPVIALRGPDVDDATFSKNLVVGSDVTLRGDIVATAADGTVTFNGKSVVGTGAATDPSKQSKVATLKVVSVNASGFPSVSVQVSAVDANGKTVTGLPASAFAVAEGGVPVGFVETSSPMQTPSVALIVDVDYPLKNGDLALDLARQLTAQVVAAGGDVTTIYAGLTSGPFTDPAAVVTALGDADDDDCWPDIAAAAGTGAVLTVFVSDLNGFTGVDGTPYQSTVYAGPPIIVVGVPDAGGTVTVPPEATAMVAATGGQSLPGAGIADTLTAVKAFFDARTKAGTYTLTYTAPVTGPAKRTVTVTTANGKQSATGRYTVPVATAGAIPAGLCGVYLDVTVDTRTVTRTLAGYRGGAAPAIDEPLTQADLDEVNGAMFGATILSFEGAAPTLSAWLDDLLTTKLAVQPLWDAANSGDVTAIRAARGATRNYLPPELAVLQCPLPAGEIGSDAGASAPALLTYQSGLRVVACTEHVQIGKGRIRKLDVLNFPGWLTFSTDAKASFAATVARSARAAVVENHVFGGAAQSAAAILAGQKLQFIDAVGVFGGELTTIPENEQRAAAEILNQYKDFYKLIPAKGSLTAFWAISADTGTVMAVLSDASGGASSPAACDDLSDASSALDALGLLGDLGPYGALGKAVASVFVATAIILDGASDPNFTYDPNALQQGIASSLACNATSDGITGALGDASGAFDAANKANTVSGIAGGASLGCGGGLDALGCGG